MRTVAGAAMVHLTTTVTSETWGLPAPQPDIRLSIPIAMINSILIVTPEPAGEVVGSCISEQARVTPSVSAMPVRQGEVSKHESNTKLNQYPDWARQDCTENQPLRWQLVEENDRSRDEHRGQVSPHNFPVDRSSTPRRNERRKNRINQGEKASEGNAEYIVHGKRPRTQLMLTLRLIWRSGKRIRHNTMACGINSPMPRIRRFSAVSRVRLAVLTIPALLLCACASAHGDDACSPPYAGIGQQLHGGRPA